MIADVIESDQENYTWRAINIRLDKATNISSRWSRVDFSSIMVRNNNPIKGTVITSFSLAHCHWGI